MTAKAIKHQDFQKRYSVVPRGNRGISIGRLLRRWMIAGQHCSTISRMTSVGTGRDLLGKGALTNSIYIFSDTFGGPGISLLCELTSLDEGYSGKKGSS